MVVYLLKTRENPDKIYVGRTTMNLDHRLYLHKNAFKRHCLRRKNQSYYTAFDVFEESERTQSPVEIIPYDLNDKNESVVIKKLNAVNKYLSMTDQERKASMKASQRRFLLKKRDAEKTLKCVNFIRSL